MYLAGWMKQTVIDYPGKFATMVFTQGCNFNCGYCHNAALIPFQEGEAGLVQKVDEHIRSRFPFLDALVISGGEPTLQPDLEDYIRPYKELGLSIKLDSNGSRPEILRRLIDQKLIDFIAMDIKADLNADAYPKAAGTRFKASYIDKIKESIELILESGIQHEFRTTLIKEIHDKDQVQRMTNCIGGCNQYALQRFNPKYVCNEEFHNYHAFSEEEMQELADSVSKDVGWVLIRN